VFTGNLSDRIHGRVVPVVETSSAPCYGFWRNVQLPSPFPRRGLLDSAIAHAALLALLYAISVWPPARVHLDDSHSFRSLNGYRLSPYLPELHGAPTRHRHGGKADPVPARQEIRSLPDAPDNLRQTIVTPPQLKLRHDVELPNLVAYKVAYKIASESLPPPQPVQAGPPLVEPPLEVKQIKPRLALPHVQPSAMQPPPSSIRPPSPSNLAQLLPPRAGLLPAAPRGAGIPMPQVVEPAPVIVQLKPRRAVPSPPPREAQPAPDAGSLSRGSAPDFAQLLPAIPAPALPAPHVAEAPPPQVVALSAHPAEVQAPAAIPEGNRRGAFAASPTGRPNATGTPGAGDSSSGAGAAIASGKINAPPGISVGAPPLPASAVAVPNAPSPKPGAPDPALRSKLMAAMRTPAIASIPPPQPAARETSGPISELENHIFAGRRSYTLAVNMPNLNAAIGSWIIHFVDRAQGLVPTPIAAPEVVRKSDPAYPGELIHDGVQGTVILTAIIRADGSVSDIAVVKSLDPQLDQNAAQALSRWIFRPALKNGQAIDLEAVITVPFRTKTSGF
jgi:TonB family protein